MLSKEVLYLKEEVTRKLTRFPISPHPSFIYTTVSRAGSNSSVIPFHSILYWNHEKGDGLPLAINIILTCITFEI